MLVLASKSPRRKELLKLITNDFIVQGAEFDETLPEDIITPEDAVTYLSYMKARLLNNGVDTVIGADTVVVLDGEILGKPADDDEAFSMLKKLSGREHSVFTGITVMSPEKWVSFTEETKVTFCPLSDDEIREYIKTGECSDKAGAYGIQGYGSRFVKSINGDYFNVVGLPVCRLYHTLRNLNDFC